MLNVVAPVTLTVEEKVDAPAAKVDDKLNDVPLAAPIFGVVRLGEFDKTTLPVPVDVVTPVPPLATAIVLPLQVPLVIVPTLVKLDPVTVDFNVVPLKVPASATTVISALPSNATPLIFLVAANFVAVAALPVNEPVKFVDVTVLKPAKVVEVAPNAILVVPIVNELLANLLFAIAVPLHTPLVIVPTSVKLTNEVKDVLEVAVIFEAVPDKVPVIVPAVKFPLASLATMALAVFALVAVVALLLTLFAVVMVANLVSAIAALELMSAFTILPVKANLL